MSIRIKLLLSYAAMLVIPLVITFFTALLLIVVFRGDLQTIREQYGVGAHRMFEDQHVEGILKEMKRSVEKNPSILSDSSYLSDLDQELLRNKSNLIVRKDHRIIFTSPSIQQTEILDHLPAFEDSGHVERDEAVHIGKQLISFGHFDFRFADQTPGSVIVVTTVNPLVNFAQKFFPILFITSIIILILTNTILTYFVSRSIIRPLQRLKNAMKRIEAGDLEFQVVPTSRDEIGELSVAFEQMRNQLQHSIHTQIQYEENRKELISNISHDLRTPLTAIRGYVDGLGDGIADTPEKRQKYIDIISSKAEEMDHLIDELFLYSKLDLNRLPFQFEIVDFHAFLLDLSEELAFDLGKQGVHYSSNITLEPETYVLIDRDKLKRVFANIMDNGLKYMDKTEKTIHLRAFMTTDDVVIQMTDNGQGIEPDALPYVFERFYRADLSRNSHTGGSGLGLAITKQIMDGHEGTIQADSTVGESTCITMTLPRRNHKVGDQQ
ncbi:two-component sensor histidine kinase [Paenibacillus selenitireducens]|uniref:histidine kinase n=1 Tax=Paenibacillus selenitireducens TaxID=1324314 RepID=A0A1T2XFH9_9BACL|nr:HAMP domain-containing sensor histidine kinase [Paenibacillus selenitireducens]OPA78644.1 two-component sensor histidine kinase [Paenibacillus selenitireducens]